MGSGVLGEGGKKARVFGFLLGSQPRLYVFGSPCPNEGRR